MNDNESKLDLFNALGARSASWDMMFVLGEDGWTYSFRHCKKKLYLYPAMSKKMSDMSTRFIKKVYFKNCNTDG